MSDQVARFKHDCLAWKQARWSVLLVIILFAVLAIHFNPWTSNIVQIHRQTIGELQHFITKKLFVENKFRHKYDTPFASQFNLNTATDQLQPCKWLEGEIQSMESFS